MDSVYGMPGAAGGLWLAALSTGMAGSVVAEADPWLYLCCRIAAGLADSIHCQRLNNMAFSRLVFPLPTVLV